MTASNTSLVDNREWLILSETKPQQREKVICYSLSMGIVIGYYLAGSFWDESMRYILPSVVGWLPVPSKIPVI